LLNHLGIASAHVAGHSFGAGIALQMAIDAPDRVRKLALLEPPLGSLVPSGAQFTEWVASVREIYDSRDKTAATDISLAGVYGQDYRAGKCWTLCGKCYDRMVEESGPSLSKSEFMSDTDPDPPSRSPLRLVRP
jgi:pimeloyl-ACP methyl ester carboxylesterase